MRKRYIGIGIAAIVIGIIAVLAMVKPAAAPQPSSSPQGSAAANSTGSPQANATAIVVYNDSGFGPAQTTINAGQSITFVNRSSSQIQVDSDPNPVHTDDPELNVGIIEAGQSKTVTLNTKGSFGFHNHLNPSMKARVTIQ